MAKTKPRCQHFFFIFFRPRNNHNVCSTKSAPPAPLASQSSSWSTGRRHTARSPVTSGAALLANHRGGAPQKKVPPKKPKIGMGGGGGCLFIAAVTRFMLTVSLSPVAADPPCQVDVLLRLFCSVALRGPSDRVLWECGLADLGSDVTPILALKVHQRGRQHVHSRTRPR